MTYLPIYAYFNIRLLYIAKVEPYMFQHKHEEEREKEKEKKRKKKHNNNLLYQW